MAHGRFSLKDIKEAPDIEFILNALQERIHGLHFYSPLRKRIQKIIDTVYDIINEHQYDISDICPKCKNIMFNKLLSDKLKK